MDFISLKVPAKINLYLKIIRKRPDGYHDIDTLMQAVSLYDELTLEKSDSFSLVCEDIPELKFEDNLAYKAAKLVAEMMPIPGAKITLIKNIPTGAGLGGGSADAAYVIRGLIKLFDLKLDKTELNRRAIKLGADVPFFFGGGQARATGIGEILTDYSLPLDYNILIIKPNFSISTAEVYHNYKIPLTTKNGNVSLEKRISPSNTIRINNQLSNDLEEVVFSWYPGLNQIKQSLATFGAFNAGMSGSGSAIFGLFSPGHDLAKIAANFRGDEFRTFICRPIELEPIP
jgi:4-diphosphocytidyl-2-C-methyl-D-erythritol kinase